MTLSAHIAPQPMVTFLDRSTIPYTTQSGNSGKSSYIVHIQAVIGKNSPQQT
ncbi:hypothetical protein DPMN_071882 [Dreissena polymorpha]|uniref:Uncharacterized protein n=1 Tax=Dreissena polymorpha TaxID=45954 RepID=A0A9D3Z8P1_DREPO|nr:hypothetical protein DPMN_071882 [Dreissena polymorpha]